MSYEYAVFKNGMEFGKKFGFKSIETAKKDFRQNHTQEIECAIRNTSGYVEVAHKKAGNRNFKHFN